ncbi:MAG: hypothetical protein HW405_265 [Candidatus Berkelbacteria bacterium]|nr:hypothetical protein [Candidatus Berkelbacteria bacterium]
MMFRFFENLPLGMRLNIVSNFDIRISDFNI